MVLGSIIEMLKKEVQGVAREYVVSRLLSTLLEQVLPLIKPKSNFDEQFDLNGVLLTLSECVQETMFPSLQLQSLAGGVEQYIKLLRKCMSLQSTLQSIFAQGIERSQSFVKEQREVKETEMWKRGIEGDTHSNSHR